MSSTLHHDFDRRSNRLLKRSKLLKRKAVYSVSDDGLILRRPRRSFSLPWRGLARIAVMVWVFKVIAVMNLGVGDYASRVNALEGGNAIKRTAAFVLHVDPLTYTVSQQLLTLDDLVRKVERGAIF